MAAEKEFQGCHLAGRSAGGNPQWGLGRLGIRIEGDPLKRVLGVPPLAAVWPEQAQIRHSNSGHMNEQGKVRPWPLYPPCVPCAVTPWGLNSCGSSTYPLLSPIQILPVHSSWPNSNATSSLKNSQDS